jgi:hypothetical protein
MRCGGSGHSKTKEVRAKKLLDLCIRQLPPQTAIIARRDVALVMKVRNNDNERP